MMAPPDPTIPALFRATVARVGEQPGLGIIRDGQLSWKNWNEISAAVESAMLSLRNHGIGSGDRVVQYAPNSYEWIVTDLAILSLGAVHVPLHATLPSIQAAEQLKLADAKLLVVPNNDSPLIRTADIECAIHDELSREGSLCDASRLNDKQSDVRNPRSCDLATILFTSGTTGQPRGVMLSHGNLASNAIAMVDAIGSTHEETRLSFLPLSHVYARTCDLYTWIYRGTKNVLAESRDTILRDCQLARPTIINGVPYFYQKVLQSLVAAGKSREHGALSELLGGQIRLCCCGGAPVAPEVEKLFDEQRFPLLPGYGLTETSPVISASSRENYRTGCVGEPLADVEVRLANDNEILVRGPNVMMGYWRDEAATHETIRDGWLYTGDLGQFEEGRLRITGRKKELLVLSTGKKVYPPVVEHSLAGSPYVEAVCVVGDGRSHLGALIVPNPQALRQFIRENRLWVWSKRRAVSHPKVRELYRTEFDRVLSGLSHEEQVGPFVLLTRNFSLERGEVTPKFSLCREVIAVNFADEIEAMYR